MSEKTRKGAQTALGAAERSKVVPLNLSRTPNLAARHAPRQPIVRIHLLGSLRATTYLGESILPRGRKARAILGYLCLNVGESVPRSRLASLLWDRVPDSQARNNLRQTLWELSSAMGLLARELISGDRETVRLEPSLCWIDALAVLSAEPPPPHSFRGDLASLCNGQLLEELDGASVSFDHWLLVERTRFTERLRALLEAELQQLDPSSTEAPRRAAMARRVIGFDATHEGASRILMRALADMGERAQALREYDRCCEALRATLDVGPSSETRALYEALRTFTGPKKRDGDVSRAIGSTQLPPELRVLSPECNRLRVGVLPLEASHSPRNERLAFSLSQEIASALARFRWFDVITPVTLLGRPSASTSQRMLGRKQLHYVVEGAVSGNEEKFQISVRLLDVTQDARPVWSDRFELTADALDKVNELITAPVVARIDPVILFIEGQPKRPQRSGATGLVMQAIPLMYTMEREKYEEAGRLLGRALEADPDNAMAAAWGAFWQVFHVGQGWSTDPRGSFGVAQDLAVRAITIDPDNAEALGIYAHVCAFLDKDFDSALYYFDRALKLNPNLAFIWALSAPTYCYIGEPSLALQRLDRYRDLAPFDPYFRYWEIASTIAYTFKGDYERAVSIGRRAVKANPEFSNAYKPLIAALGHLGRREEAAAYIKKLLSLEPNFTVASFGKVYPIRKPEDRERYMQGLRLAGVPEG
jgi:DNA-binding SARP family transcriptional activator/TolB-like protein